MLAHRARSAHGVRSAHRARSAHGAGEALVLALERHRALQLVAAVAHRIGHRVERHQRLLHRLHKVLHHVARHVGLDDDAEHCLGLCSVRRQRQLLLREWVVVRHLVARDVPVMAHNCVLEVDVIKAHLGGRVEVRCHDGQAAVVAVVTDDEARHAAELHLAESMAQEGGVGRAVGSERAVALLAEAVELVVLHIDAGRGAAEVQGVGVALPTEIRN
mmetsp:Transcript_38330/g.113653  ORF Transcript_38330/g.113653 Transcript_38330/m.113653 type:complete len:217 (-) Transcript_38330:1309-1959(-)